MRDYNGYFPHMKIIKSKKKKLAITSFYFLDQETRLNGSWKLIYINQSRFYNFFHVGNSKMLNITSKYFSIFNGKHTVIWIYLSSLFSHIWTAVHGFIRFIQSLFEIMNSSYTYATDDVESINLCYNFSKRFIWFSFSSFGRCFVFKWKNISLSLSRFQFFWLVQFFNCRDSLHWDNWDSDIFVSSYIY